MSKINKIRIVDHINDMFFPNNMPGFPDYPSANDNERLANVFYGIAGVFKQIQELSDSDAMAALEIIGNFTQETISVFREKYPVD